MESPTRFRLQFFEKAGTNSFGGNRSSPFTRLSACSFPSMETTNTVEPFAPSLLSQKGSLYLTRPTLYHYIAAREELERAASELFEVVTSGKVKIDVKQRFALKDAAEAHRALEGRRTKGSTIFII